MRYVFPLLYYSAPYQRHHDAFWRDNLRWRTSRLCGPHTRQCVCVLLLTVDHHIYHCGDTAAFSDMKVIDDIYTPDVALLCIGDFYTMGPREAAYAVNNVLTCGRSSLVPSALQDRRSHALQDIRSTYGDCGRVQESDYSKGLCDART